MKFSSRFRLADQLWQEWLDAYDDEFSRLRVQSDPLAKTAFRAGVMLAASRLTDGD